MGNAQTLVTYGMTPENCLNSLKCQLDYEWEGKLFLERHDREKNENIKQRNDHNRELTLPILTQEKTKRYYVLNSNNEKCYVQFFKRTSGPVELWKAVISL
jgi:hypothetical protein